MNLKEDKDIKESRCRDGGFELASDKHLNLLSEPATVLETTQGGHDTIG